MYSPQRPLARSRVPRSPEREKPSQPNPAGSDLESSLLEIFTEHHHTSLFLRETTERAKKESIRNAVRVADLLVDEVNGGVQESFINEKRIELEFRALATSIARFMKQTDQWLSATHSMNTAIKEIGDFENWMKTMEFDCKSITAAIHSIHQE